ncbi:MAG: TonB-dependent receptor [Acidobacteria bacterium]|nr:TonB-dependent receptor [Acidobacteriota bacterium]
MQTLGRTFALIFLTALLFVPVPASAQEAKTGRLTGVVKDALGAVIPGAGVVATDDQTKASFRTMADGVGAWAIARIPASSYTVTITAPSTVSAVLKNIKVEPGGAVTADATLQVGISETVIVTASRTEELLVNAPAAVTIVNDRTIEASPTQNYADLMRTVPGVNVVQMSARDFSVTPRQATVIPAGSQLVMIDGRSTNQDYFGYVAWDFLPTNLGEIKQIEVLRGPASAVWGPSAMNGVVNIITKSPREMAGTTLTMGVGTFDRKGGLVDPAVGATDDAGSLYYVSLSHAMIINDRWAMKASAGYYQSDPMARPAGTLPDQPTVPYPPFRNYGTKQPKVDLRLDYDSPNGLDHLSFSGGYARTGGTFHTGLGPFHLEDGAYGGYGKAEYRRAGLTVRSFVNLWGGTAPSILAVGPLGAPILNYFSDRTWDISGENVQMVGGRHLLTYGANFRHNWTNMTMAPLADKRDTIGGYLQDEVILSEQFRWNVGVRADKFDSLDHAVVSPRTALLFSPMPGSTFRVSYSRAYRAPSLFQNYMDTVVANRIPLDGFGLAGQFAYFPVKGLGSLDLKEQTLDGYEAGYSASLAKGRVHFGVTYYLNDSRHDMILSPTAPYTSQNPPPPPGFPSWLAAYLVPTGPIALPSALQYQNIGQVRNQGVETSVDAQATRYVSVFANYSWQAKPVPKDFDISLINLPPKHRFNAGLMFDYKRIQGDVSVGYTSEAYFRDILTYAGWIKGFTVINAGLGVRLAGDNAVLVVKIRNLGNEPVQNHLFSDLLKRQIVAELRLRR